MRRGRRRWPVPPAAGCLAHQAPLITVSVTLKRQGAADRAHGPDAIRYGTRALRGLLTTDDLERRVEFFLPQDGDRAAGRFLAVFPPRPPRPGEALVQLKRPQPSGLVERQVTAELARPR